MRIYIICPVRNADPVVIERMRGYVNFLKLNGHDVHYPPDDVPQDDPTGKVINTMHRDAMIKADEVHVFWDVIAFRFRNGLCSLQENRARRSLSTRQ